MLGTSFSTDKKVYAWLQNRHSKGSKFINKQGVYKRRGHEWKVPYGVRQALGTPLLHEALVHRYPFQVQWTSPKTGKRLRKNMETLAHAIIFIAEKAQYVDPQASIISRHGFYIPTSLMGKFPRQMRDEQGKAHTYYWCPRCMQPRRFKRNGEDFLGVRKTWVTPDKGVPHWDWLERRLALTLCTTCGISNRDTKFRSCNQPVEKRRFKQGVTRARRRKG